VDTKNASALEWGKAQQRFIAEAASDDTFGRSALLRLGLAPAGARAEATWPARLLGRLLLQAMQPNRVATLLCCLVLLSAQMALLKEVAQLPLPLELIVSSVFAASACFVLLATLCLSLVYIEWGAVAAQVYPSTSSPSPSPNKRP
jgi:hypothetical protein